MAQVSTEALVNILERQRNRLATEAALLAAEVETLKKANDGLAAEIAELKKPKVEPQPEAA